MRSACEKGKSLYRSHVTCVADVWILSYSNHTANIFLNDAGAVTLGSLTWSRSVLDPNSRRIQGCSRRFNPDSTVVLTSRPTVAFGAYVISVGPKVASYQALGMELLAVPEENISADGWMCDG